jgi:nucleoside-diphosphate-sugar epimerase
MIVAVTGGTGFIGRALVSRLEREPSVDEVRVLGRRRGFDLTGPADALVAPLRGVDLLFHCAGETRSEAAMRALHVEGTRRLIEAARGRVARWVQLSSVGVYGRARRSGTVDESAAFAPEGEYEVTKAESERLAADAAASGAFSLAVLRPSFVFGAGMPSDALYQMIAALERGRFAYLGRAGAIANCVCVEDTASALALCGLAPHAAGAYNLSDDRPLEAFVGSIAAALGRRGRIPRLPEGPLRLLAGMLGRLPGFPLTLARIDTLTRRVRYSSARIQGELGFRFGVSVEDALQRLVQDWRAARVPPGGSR